MDDLFSYKEPTDQPVNDYLSDIDRFGLPRPPGQHLRRFPWLSPDHFLIDLLHWRARAKRSYLTWYQDHFGAHAEVEQ